MRPVHQPLKPFLRQQTNWDPSKTLRASLSARLVFVLSRGLGRPTTGLFHQLAMGLTCLAASCGRCAPLASVVGRQKEVNPLRHGFVLVLVFFPPSNSLVPVLGWEFGSKSANHISAAQSRHCSPEVGWASRGGLARPPRGQKSNYPPSGVATAELTARTIGQIQAGALRLGKLEL